MSIDKKHYTLKHQNTLYHALEGKRNMWIYHYPKSKSIFLIDPVNPSIEVIQLIDSLKLDNIFVVLTACQREKKNFTKLWQKLFPELITICPDKSFIKNERIIEEDVITRIDGHNDIEFFSTRMIGGHSLCIKSKQYIFIGELIHNVFIDVEDFAPTEITLDFFSELDDNTIILPSSGPISILSNLKNFEFHIKEHTKKLLDAQDVSNTRKASEAWNDVYKNIIY